MWWLLHDGGILILVAYLLQRHATWRRCTLRIFTVVQVSLRIDDSFGFGFANTSELMVSLPTICWPCLFHFYLSLAPLD